MKKVLAIIIVVLITIVSVGGAYADEYRSDMTYFTDIFSVESEDNNRIEYDFITEKDMYISSTGSGVIYVDLSVETDETMQKLGFTSLKVQRWNGSCWTTDREVTNEFETSTNEFSYINTFTGLSSGYQYRVKVTLRARRAAGEVQDLTCTSSSITCH